MTQRLSFQQQVSTEDELQQLVGYPSELVRHKVIDHLDDHCQHFIGLSPYLLMATSDLSGACDAQHHLKSVRWACLFDSRTGRDTASEWRGLYYSR